MKRKQAYNLLFLHPVGSMKNTIIFLSFLLITLSSLTASKSFAEEKSSGSSASITQFAETNVSDKKDSRVEILRSFLRQYDSPLADNADSFIIQADKYNLDWKLLPAISGVESTFGHAVPMHCNNAWGYNIYASVTRCFETYDDAISVISHDLRNLYMDEWGAKDVWEIGRLYAASPTWAYRVHTFMNEISDYAVIHDNHPLPISL